MTYEYIVFEWRTSPQNMKNGIQPSRYGVMEDDKASKSYSAL